MSKMNILTLDIETAPNLVWAWNNMLWQSAIPHNYIIEPSFIMCWAAKWHGKNTVFYRKHTQVDFLSKLWELMDKADAVITYNGKKFDRKYINAAFIRGAWYRQPTRTTSTCCRW